MRGPGSLLMAGTRLAEKGPGWPPEIWRRTRQALARGLSPACRERRARKKRAFRLAVNAPRGEKRTEDTARAARRKGEGAAPAREAGTCLAQFPQAAACAWRILSMKIKATAARLALAAVLLTALAAAWGPAARADTIARWDFENGVNPSSGTQAVAPYASFVAPVEGAGVITVGGPTPPVVPSPPDPYVGPVGGSWYFTGNGGGLAWNVTPLGFVTGTISKDNPAEGTSYVQFATSTEGKQDITVQFDLRCSGTAPNRARLQYTTDGSNWTDFVDPVLGNPFVTATASGTWKTLNFNLASIKALNNNANAAFRVTAATDSSLTPPNYKGVSSSIGTGGTWRFDNVLIAGNTLGATGPVPTITGPVPTSTIIDPVTYTVMFDAPVTGFDSPSDVVVTAAGTASAAVTSVTGTSGTKGPYTVTVEPQGGTGAVTITIPENVCNAVSGGAGNRGSAPSAAFNIVSDPRVSWVGDATASVTKNGPVSFTCQFNVPVVDFNSADDVLVEVLDGDPVAGTVTVSGSTDPTPSAGPYTITLSNITGNGVLRVRVKAGAANNNGIPNSQSSGSSVVKVIQPDSTVTQWTFDSVVPDGNPVTGTLDPFIGAGEALLGPGVQAASSGAFATGVPYAGPNGDNSGWNTSPLAGLAALPTDPPISADNPPSKSRWIEFKASTLGFKDIVLAFDQQYSDTAANTTVMQYTTDGTNWTDLNTLTATFSGQYQRGFALPADAADKAEFAVRMAADIDPTFGNYKRADGKTDAASNNGVASPGGTWRFDTVTLYGNLTYVPGPAKSVQEAKALPDNSLILVEGVALYQKGSNFAYVEDTQRTAGLRLEGSIAPAEGSLVKVSGRMKTTPGGERAIAVLSAESTGVQTVAPLGVVGRSLGQTLLDGLYVRAWGKVVSGSVTANSFVISDGSEGNGVKVVTQGAPGVSGGEYVVVTGAAGTDGGRVIYRK